MAIATLYPHRFFTCLRRLRPWCGLYGLGLVAVLLLASCNGSHDDDNDTAGLRDEAITGSTLEVTLPPGFGPEDIDHMQLAVSGGNPPQPTEFFDLRLREVTLGDRNILAFAVSDTANPIAPGTQRQFTLLAFPTATTIRPNLIGQEITDVLEEPATKVVMKLYQADAQLEVVPPSARIAVGEEIQLRARANFTARCSPADPPTCAAIGFRTAEVFVGPPDERTRRPLTEEASWTVLPDGTLIQTATVSNAPGSKGRGRGIAAGTTQIMATVETIEGTGALIVTTDPVDPAVCMTIAGVGVPEGDVGMRDITLTVRLFPSPNQGEVTVDFTTEDGQATALEDYLTSKGTLTFPSGVTEQQLIVSIIGDLDPEPDESFLVRLLNPQPATVNLSCAEAQITILDDDRFCANPVKECTGDLTALQLDGTCFFAAGDPPLTFQWSAPTCSLNDATAAMPVASCALGKHTFTLTTNTVSSPLGGTITIQDTIAPEIACNVPDTIPLSELSRNATGGQGRSFQATATDQCAADVFVTIIGVECLEPTAAGTRINNTPPCNATINGDTITITNPSATGQRLTWTVRADDGHGNVAQRQCTVQVVDDPR